VIVSHITTTTYARGVLTGALRGAVECQIIPVPSRRAPKGGASADRLPVSPYWVHIPAGIWPALASSADVHVPSKRPITPWKATSYP
jgi:hypothetical protein